MKLQLPFLLSLCALSSFPLFAQAAVQCDKTTQDAHYKNYQVALLDSYLGPVKSIVMTSTLPPDGRFKAIKGEAQLDECGVLTKYSASMQEYNEGNIESNIIRMTENMPYDFKYKFQLKNRHITYTFYVHEIFSKNAQNIFDKKISSFYNESGSLIGKDTSHFTINDNQIALENIQSEDTGKNVQHTIIYKYNNEGKLLETVEDGVVTLAFEYDSNGKLLKQTQSVKGFGNELKTYDFKCVEWDNYKNCTLANLESTIKIDGTIINYSKAVIHNQFEYYE